MKLLSISGGAALIGATFIGATLIATTTASAAPTPAEASAPADAAAPLVASDGRDAPPARPVAIGTFLSGSTLDLVLRHYAESLQLEGYADRNAWIQGARLGFASGFTSGAVGLGLDASLYGALKLGGGHDVHNLALIAPGGASRDKTAWAYLGEYAVKAHTDRLDVKLGVQPFYGNPFLDPYDVRTHPPTFRGLSIVATPAPGLTVSAGGVNGVYARGADFIQSLSAVTSGTPFKRQTYLGAQWDGGERKLMLFASRSQDLWDQFYASAARSVGSAAALKWTAKADLYYTVEQGAARQGAINNKSYSSSVTVQHRGSSLLFGFQHIDSDQFFDYTKETGGELLDNSVGVDYNAPHEKSLQLRYKYRGEADGLAGFQLSLWGVRGYGVDGSVEARRHPDRNDPLYPLYWQNGQAISGGHFEIGSRLSYVVQAGQFKNLRVSLFSMKHKMDPSYPYINFVDYRLTLELPVKLGF